MRRRSLLFAGLATGVGTARARVPVAQALRLGADVALVASGLAAALQRGFGRDTGLPVVVVAVPVSSLLENLAAGEFDFGLSNLAAPPGTLEAQGLLYDRRSIAKTEFWLVGPAEGPDPAFKGFPSSDTLPGKRQAIGADIATSLHRLRQHPGVESGALSFLSCADGSGTHLMEQAAWRLAGVAPEVAGTGPCPRTHPLLPRPGDSAAMPWSSAANG
jgi:tungstate transport system substrate-binding protein